MHEEFQWVRVLNRRGSPVNGAILNSGAVVRLPKPWADRWISEGDAVATDDPHAAKPAPKPEPVAKPKKK